MTAIHNLRQYYAELEQENAELKKEYSDNLSLKDEELMCLETEFNTYKSEAKEILQLFLKLKTIPCASGNSVNMLQFENICKQAEQFLKE
jgi:hypothetical protein